MIKNFLKLELWLISLTITASIFAYLIFADLKLITSYNDAMSHLNISRLIVDNMEPGLAQLGGVWLPMSHLLPLILIWNYSAWQSGFAGSLISMLSFIISVWAISKTVYHLTLSKGAAFISGLGFAFNLNMLYLQATPLTESLYLVFFCLSALYFIKWLKFNQEKQLLALGILGFFQVLTRYDGWFVVFFETILIGIVLLFLRKDSIKHAIGKLTLFVFPVIFGLFLWIAWNALIFHDPLFFALGPYSAHAQQETISRAVEIITKGHMQIAAKAYSIAAVENVGSYLMLFSLFGTLVLLFKNSFLKEQPLKAVIISFLLLPVFFNIVALYLGFSILNVPSLKWYPSPNPAGQWFNVRYGIFALPFAAVFLGIFASRLRVLALVALIVICFQGYVTFNEGLVTVADGVVGTSSFADQDLSDVIKTKVSKTDKLLISTSFFNPVVFKSGLELDQIIHEGVSKKWPEALVNPQQYSQWVVVANNDIGDPLHKVLIQNQKGRFLQFYSLEYKGVRASLYKLKNQNLVQR